MANFINTVDVIGDELLTESLLCRSVTEYKDDTVQQIGIAAFKECKSLVIVDTPAVGTINMDSFSNCTKLTALILRNVSMVRLDSSSAFSSTPIKTGTGYIYVPRALIDSYKAAINWSTYANQFRVLEDYTDDGTTTGEFVGPSVWDEVADAIAGGTYSTEYAIGDTVPLSLGSYGEINMQIVAFDADKKEDGSTAAITWIALECFESQYVNSGSNNKDGWEVSKLRGWMRSDLYEKLPTKVKNLIAPVQKTYYDYTSQSTKTCTDTVWIPSVREVVGNSTVYYGCEDSGAVYNDVFPNQASRVKYDSGGTGQKWWTRSAHETRGSDFQAISTNGYIIYDKTDTAHAVVLGFCT